MQSTYKNIVGGWYGYIQEKNPTAKFFTIENHTIPLNIIPINKLRVPLNLILFFPLEIIKISGEDSLSFIQGLITADLKSLNEKNKVLRTFICSNDGHIRFDCWIEFININKYLFYLEPTTAKHLIKHLEFYHIVENIKIKIEPSRLMAYIWGKNKVEKTPFYQIIKNNLQIVKAIDISKNDPIIIKNQLIGFEEYEQIRPYFNWPRSGIDFTNKNYPLETGIDDIVSYKKGCFIGQEPISRMYNKGRVTKKIIQVYHNQQLNMPALITLEDRKIGQITSTSNLKIENNYYSLATCKTNILNQPNFKLFSQGIELFIKN